MMTTTERLADVAIVGAGLAGLQAARSLRAAGLDPLVLEARDRVGGRIYSIRAGDDVVIDMGGQWLGARQPRLDALATELGVTTFPTYTQGENIQIIDSQQHRYAGSIPMVDPLVTMDIVEAMTSLNTMAYDVPLDAPWQAAQAAEWDAQTFATWMERNVPSPDARDVLTIAIRAVFCAEPRDLSLLHVLFYTHSGGSLNELVNVQRGAQERRFHEGSQEVAKRMAAVLGDRLILNAPVQAVEYDGSGVRVIAENVTVRARAAVIALPPVLAGRLRYTPELPALRDQLTQRVPMGTVYKIHCLYPTPFWREQGLSGQVTSAANSVATTFDNSPEDARRGVMLAFIEGDAARAISQRSPDERRAIVLADLTAYFGAEATTPQDYFEQFWAGEQYTRGCYGGYMPPGVWSSFGPALRAPISHLFWAGTETATEWSGYMEGALQSGTRAAEEVRLALGL
jgi:monoamine oxidase